MATIPGSQFQATVPNLPLNIVQTTDGTVPAPISGDFNLEVFLGGTAGSPATPAAGYQGLMVVSPSGLALDLISGAFAVTDNGSGNDTLSAHGSNETISGGPANVLLNLFGNNEVANGGGQDTINVFGNADTVNGNGDDLINVFGTGDQVAGGSGNDTINVSGTGNSVAAGSGNNLINVLGSADTITAGTGNDTINLSGNGFVVAGGPGNTMINASGNGDTIGAGTGSDTIAVSGLDNMVALGTGNDTVFISGSNDTVLSGSNAGGNHGQINLSGQNMTLTDGPNQYADTVIGFDQGSGDRIHLTTDTAANAVAHSTAVNGGADTLITLSDGSTLLLKGVTHIDSTFFS